MSNKQSSNKAMLNAFNSALKAGAFTSTSSYKATTFDPTYNGFSSAYEAQMRFEWDTHPVNLDNSIKDYIANNQEIQAVIEGLATVIVGMPSSKLPVRQLTTPSLEALKFLSKHDLTSQAIATVCIRTVLEISKDFTTLSEIGAKIASMLASSIKMTAAHRYQLPQVNINLQSYGYQLAVLLGTCKLIEVEVYGGRAIEDSEEKTPLFIKVVPKLFLSKELRGLLRVSGENMLPSYIPHETMVNEGDSPYKSGIPFNIFNSVHLRKSGRKFPMKAINVCNQMPLYIDQGLLAEYDELPIPYNLTKSYQKKNFKNQHAFTKVFMEHLGDNPCFITHCLDSKDRIYDKSRYIKKQGNDSYKALVDAGVFTVSTAEQYKVSLKACKIQIANCLDLDKLTINDRIMIVDSLIVVGDLDKLVLQVAELGKLKKDKKAPVMQLRKAIRELYKIAGFGGKYSKLMAKEVSQGKRTIDMRGMVALDATCSFAQICAILSGLLTDAWNSNVLDKGHNRIDLYTKVFEIMKTNPNFKPKKLDIGRGEAKDGVLQTVYGSSTAWEIFKGSNAQESKDNKAIFEDAMNQVIPGTMEVLKHMHSLLNKNATEYSWKLPDGCEAVCYHTTIGSKTGSTKSKKRLTTKVPVFKDGKVVAIDDVYAHRSINGAENIGLKALTVQSVDAFIARTLITECHKLGFAVFSIHDSFACQYVHMDQMKGVYSDIIAYLASIDLLASMTKDISGGTRSYTKSPFLADAIKLYPSEHNIC